MKKYLWRLVGVFIILLFTGCATTQLQTQSKMTRTITLDHSAIKSKRIYLQITNTSGGGGEKMNLKDKLIKNFEVKGYKLVENSSEADYGLFINILFSNNLKEAYAIKAALGYGTATAGINYASGGSGSEALVAGIAMAVGAGLVGKAFEDEIYRSIIDVNIRTYQNSLNEKSSKNFDEHLTRVFVEAVKMNLKLEEALPILEDKTASQISNLF